MSSHADSHGHDEIHLPQPTFWPLLLGLGFVMLPLGFIAWSMEAGGGSLISRFYAGQAVFGVGFLLVLFSIGGWLVSNIRANEPALAGVEAGKFAMWAYLGTETIIFGGLIANAFFVWLRNPDVNDKLHTFSAMMIVSANTFILLVSSLTVVLGLAAIQQGKRNDLIKYIGVTALLGTIFVGIQAYEYSHLIEEGITITSSQFGQAFYMLTGFHGLHVIVGVIWALVVIFMALRGVITAQRYMAVEIFGLYWHFVDVVWIIIFTVIYLV